MAKIPSCQACKAHKVTIKALQATIAGLSRDLLIQKATIDELRGALEEMGDRIARIEALGD